MEAFNRLNETLKNVVGNVIACFLADHPELGEIRCNCEMTSASLPAQNDDEDCDDSTDLDDSEYAASVADNEPTIVEQMQQLGQTSATERIALVGLAVAGRRVLDAWSMGSRGLFSDGLKQLETALDMYAVATGGCTGRQDNAKASPTELAALACRLALGMKDTAVKLIDKAQGATAA